MVIENLPPEEEQQQQKQPSLSVEDAMAQMAVAIQRGDFQLAESIGRSAPVPLSIPDASLYGTPISEGAQAAVYAAQLDGAPVAVKKAHIREPEDLVRLRRELALLAKLRHPHIVGLLGARMMPPRYCLVLRLEATNAAHELHAGGWRPGWHGALHLGAQLASAVALMASQGIIHRDLKPANLLLSSDRRHSRLADFGVAIFDTLAGGDSRSLETGSKAAMSRKPSGGFYKLRMVGTLEYMAPEVLMKGASSFASDVFSLAVTINELAAARVPYADCTRENPQAHTILEMGYGRQELAAAVAAEGLRPTPGPGAPPAVLRLLRACWDADPSMRPPASEVAAKLAALSAAFPWGESDADVKERVAGPAPASNGAGPLDSADLQDDGDLPLPEWARSLLESDAAGREGGDKGQVALGSFATAGARGEDRMEDRCVALKSLFGLQRCSLAAVFDGHRGPQASDYLASNMERHLQARWADSAGPGELLRRALLDADAAFRGREDAAWAATLAATPDVPPRRFPGSTAAVALLVGSRLAVANLGDSRAVLCRGGAAVALTRDQTAEREDERARVEAAGGDVSVRMGGWRVGASGLAVTRSVGDADLKDAGVTAEAEVDELEVGPQDTFVVLGSDGVWDLVSSEEAVDLVHDTVKQPALCAQRIVTEAMARGSRDNVTVVVVFFSDAAGTAEQVFTAGQGLKYESVAAARGVFS